MLQILAADIERLGLAWLPGARRQLAAFDHGAHLLQSGVGADRPAALTDEFQAVVIRRIVARGHHDPAIELGGKSREVDALRATKADVLDVDPGIVQATDQRRRKRLAGGADVAPHGDPSRLDESGVGAADLIDQLLIELGGNAAANVVGLETGELRHRFVPSRPYWSSSRTISSSPR